MRAQKLDVVAQATESNQPDAAADERTHLFPRRVRHGLLGGLGLLLAMALYLIAVRGSTILFDLRDAVSAICF